MAASGGHSCAFFSPSGCWPEVKLWKLDYMIQELNAILGMLLRVARF